MHRLTRCVIVGLVAVVATLAPAAMAQDASELRMAENQFPTSLDSDVGFAGYSLMSYGVAEALMRVTPDMQIVPWLADSLNQVDPLTWQATIRGDAAFWDGTPLDAAAVVASLERSVAKQPGTAALLPAGTTFAADGQVLTINLPQPVGALPNNLAAYNFAIKKVETGSEEPPVYTGPYIFADYVPQQSITLRANHAYWGGAPGVETIRVRLIPDVAARVLALQSGDVDVAHALLPSDAEPLRGAGLQVHSFPFGRQDDILLNVNRAPLNDVGVRQAVAAAIDRQALVDGVLRGTGTPALGFAPENLGLSGVLHTQHFAPEDARAVLERSGWVPGGDGVRAKNGQRLAFKLGSYASRAELAPLAVAIKDQLRGVGMDVTLETFADINTTVATNAFDATLYSYGVAPFGDLGAAVATLYVPGGTNKDRYSNPQLNSLFGQYNQIADPGERQRMLSAMQELIGQDTPVVYLVNPYQIVATSPRVLGYTPHPLENYKIDAALALRP
jgi:peptide/nickel transport system substrate-binding protein